MPGSSERGNANSSPQVEAWYDDPDYQEAMASPHAASTMNMLLIEEGADVSEAPDPKL